MTRGIAIMGGIVVAVAVIVVAYLLGTHTSDHHPALAAGRGTTSPSTAAAPAVHPSAGGVADPVTTATAWLRAYRGLQWTDSSPSAWVDRVRPYVGDDLAKEYDRAREGSAGSTWTAFVRDKCTATVSEVGAVIPPEAPRAPDSVYVQVAGTVLTECAAGQPPAPSEPVAATVEVRRSAGGRWVVSRRLF
ncbi:MAG: hypothetical protein ACRDQX_08520 [Pseudonocardiaceae bacterium]